MLRRELLRTIATWAAAVVGLRDDEPTAIESVTTASESEPAMNESEPSAKEPSPAVNESEPAANESEAGANESSPPATETETAVVDRIEDGTAVVLFERSGRQRTVPPPVLPPAAREEGAVLRVPDGDDLALATVDRAATRERRQTAQDRFDELSERPEQDS